MRTLIAVTVAILLTAAFSIEAQAAVQYLSVNWDSAYERGITFLFDGSSRRTAAAPAAGYIDGTLDHVATPGGRSISRMFCVDLFQPAYDWDAIPGDNQEYEVHEYTELDGTTGWTTPVGGTDRYRDLGSITRTAWVVNVLGRAVPTQAHHTALQIVVWKAAYGSRFDYVSGLSAAEEGYYNDYLALYNEGHEATTYTWYDNNYLDDADIRQDFMETPPIPEPGTLLLLGTGLLGMARAGIRRRRGA